MLTILCLLGCPTGSQADVDVEPQPPAAARAIPRHVTLFGVIPEDVQVDPPSESLVSLGRMLFHDARLSAGQSVSCNSCHPLDRYGASPVAASGAAPDGRPSRNAPSVYNAALQFRQYWDGRADDIEGAVREAFTNPHQMGMPTQTAVLEAIQAIPGYREAFAAAFPGDPDPITYGSVGKAVGAFLRTRTTPGSKLDLYQAGDLEALTPEELAGFERFVSIGCVTCHSGPLLGGGMLQRLGAAHPYETEDLGLGFVTGREEDARLFKVPMLRNVVHTGPWFHDGSVKTLPEAVKGMAHHQLDRELSEAELASLLLFLETLTGALPGDAADVPDLP